MDNILYLVKGNNNNIYSSERGIPNSSQSLDIFVKTSLLMKVKKILLHKCGADQLQSIKEMRKRNTFGISIKMEIIAYYKLQQ